MKKRICELEDGDTGIDIEAKVVEVSETKTVQTRFGPSNLKEYIIEDETGNAKLTLWGNMSNKLRMDDEISLTDVKVKSYHDQVQLNITKNSKIDIKGFKPKKNWVD